MCILKNNYARLLGRKDGILGRTKFQYRTLFTQNLSHCTTMERAIETMRNLIIRHKKGITAEDVNDEASIKGET